MNKNTFAKHPPMGWNSYDYYDTTVNEAQVRKNAEYMAEHLKEYGWEYIVVDIQWYAHGAGSQRDRFQYIPFSSLETDEFSRLQPDPERFPSSVGGKGFAPLAKYIPSLGLKFGIHIMRGVPRIAAHLHTPVKGTNVTADQIADPSSICGWNPDMYGVRNTPEGQAYYDSLLELYASWGVDFIKCDDICNTNLYPNHPFSGRHEIEMLAGAIQKCGRPIVLSLSPGPALIDKAWHYEKYANMWRITDDFWDDWKLLKDMFRRCELWQNHVSEGCWPDCDMLPLGKLGKGFGQERDTKFTPEEQQTMMTLWCIFGSPMMIGAELPLLDKPTLALLTNREVLHLLHPECRAKQVRLTDDSSVWVSLDSKTGSVCAALFNLSDSTASVSVELDELLETARACKALPDSEDPVSLSALCEASDSEELLPVLQDLWTKESRKADSRTLTAELPAHGCVLWKLCR